jgi:hypothetical protein
MGKEVFNQQVTPISKQILIDTHDWATGLYAFKFIIPNSKVDLHGKFEVAH